MLRTLLYISASLTLLMASVFGVPVAVNDSFATDEDTQLATGGAPYYSDAFPANASGFTFANDVFGVSTNPSNAQGTGAWSSTLGNPAGCLSVDQPFRPNTLAVRDSGWSKGFTLASAQTVRVTFDYRAITSGAAAGATSKVSSRIGTTGPATTHFTVTGNADSAWRTATFTAALGAGATTLQIGVICTNSGSGGTCLAYFDNVKVEPLVGGGVLTNDTGGAVSAALVANVTHGALTLNADGSFLYTPAANYNGPDSFTYTASDGTTTSNVATVSLTVNSVNDAPVGNNDSYSTFKDVTLNVPVGTGVLVNDTDVDTAAGSLTAAIAANAANGVVTMNPNGSFTYVPTLGYAGSDNFTYTVSDGALQSAPTVVNITVVGQNAPVAVADSYTLVRNSSFVVTQTTPGTVLEAVVPFLATNWKYLDNGTDQGTAWRAPGFVDTAWKTGTAELGYGDGDEATVVDDNPTPGYDAVASDRYITTYFRKTFSVTDAHRVTNVAIYLKYDDAGIVYINGTQVLITPGLSSGAAFNALSSSSNENANLTVNLTLPASALVEGTNVVAVEIHQTLQSSSDISMDCKIELTKTVYAGVLANDSDADGDPMTAVLVTNVTNGALTLNANGTFTYTPAAGFAGTDSFVYRASDGSLNSANTTATLTVIAGANQPPVVVADSYNGTEDTTLNVAAAQGVLANDSDGEGDTFTAELVAGPIAAQGTLTLNANGSFVFTPTANFFGPATFTYRARDVANAVSTSATVTINVAGVNDVPAGVADSYSTDPGVTLNVPAAGVLANDSDADANPLTAVLVSGLNPANSGTLTFNTDGSLSYVPAVGFLGTTTFVYRANDGTANSANTTVTIRLNGRPLANNDTYAATEDVPLTVSAAGVLANDTDPENDPITAVLVSAPIPAQGSLVLNANGSFTFTPAVNFNGAATFTYKANDAGRDSIASATVTINVAPVNDAPVGVPDSYVTGINQPITVAAATGVLANDTDVENSTLSATLVSQPLHGTLVFNVNGSFTFTPTAGYIGPDSFTYRASDGALLSAVTTVNLQAGFDPKAVIINEIMYHPASENDLHEYIELFNTATGPIDLTGWKFTKGIDFTFPAISIPAGGYLIVAPTVAGFNGAYGSVSQIVGGWVGTLANGGETIRLQYPDSTSSTGYTEADQVDYSKEGDWGQRRAFTDSETGWEWQTRSDGLGDSLELINPSLANNNGENWTKREISAAGNQRTPGGPNTQILLTPTPNIAPLISKVKHFPPIPGPSQTVNVTATISDELTTGVTGAVLYRTWTPNQSTAGGNFTQVNMLDDGLHGDGLANDGVFGGTLPVQVVNTIVEFYVRATDSASNVRTWPAPTTTAGAQGANCLYQVDTETWGNRQPIYRLISTGLDENGFQVANWNQNSQAAINVTFISSQGTDIKVHYQSGIRVRGAGSRSNNPRNWKIEWVADDPFNNQTQGNLNIAYPYCQYIGAQLMKQANLPHEGATPVQVRLNHTNYAGSASDKVKYGYGMYVHMQPIGDATYMDDNFTTDSNGNIYKKVRQGAANWTVRTTGVNTPDFTTYIADGWQKQSNTGENNWNDLHAWMKMITSSYNEATMSVDMDIDQWCRALAMATILNDAETNISSGANDDFGMYFGAIDKRAKLLIHDYDTILGGGDTGTTANGNSIYSMTDPSFAAGNGEVLAAMTNFYSDPQINHRYKAQLYDLLNTVFLPANFNSTVDAQLTDWVSPGAGNALPATMRDGFKTYAATRRTYILGQIVGTFSAACTLSQTGGFYTTTTANSTGLSGTVNPVTTHRVTVNGVSVSLNNYIAGAAGSGDRKSVV